ncbi:hypothetical protein ES703_80745 [subsurface metagenome]
MNYNNNQNLQRIVKIPCPHCSFLCSPQIKFCSKCGEPLPKDSFSKELISSKDLPIIESHGEKIIKFIEREIQKPIPLLDKLKPNLTGYVSENGVIIGLSLFKCRLNAIPPRIMNLKRLKRLFLRRNKIKELPELIGFLSDLEMLDLRINEISALPSSIGLLSNLKYLNISSNTLFSLPESIGNLTSLIKLNLNNNKLKSLPDSLGTLKQLKELKVKANFWITLLESVKSMQKNGLILFK